MKLSNSEAMKQFKELEKHKCDLMYFEENRCCVSYREGETKTVVKYDYKDTRKNIAEINEKCRAIKYALAVANCTVKIDNFDITIGEALVMLAQLNIEVERLNELTCKNQIERRITSNGIIEYTECLFDVESVVADLMALRETVGALQIAIDRANLTNIIEI